MKNATTEELLTRVTIGLSGRVSPSALSAQNAHAELARRLRELVPLLEEMRANCADFDEGNEFREELDRALVLAKGGEER